MKNGVVIKDVLKLKLNKLPKMLTCMVLALAMLPMMFTAAAAEGAAAELLDDAAGYIVIDANTGEHIVESNSDLMALPASTTKIMTLALSLELLNKDKHFLETTYTRVSKDAADVPNGSTNMDLKEGEYISLWDLLMGIELASANDGAEAIAEAVSGSIPKFVDEMNRKAQELGCYNTHFVNPHGYTEEGHYTTPEDLARITQWALSVPLFKEVFGTVRHIIPETNMSEERDLKTGNKLGRGQEYAYSGIIGGKKGWTPESMYTLSCAAERDGHRYIAVVMGVRKCSHLFNDATELLEYAFATAATA